MLVVDDAPGKHTACPCTASQCGAALPPAVAFLGTRRTMPLLCRIEYLKSRPTVLRVFPRMTFRVHFDFLNRVPITRSCSTAAPCLDELDIGMGRCSTLLLL